MNCPHKMGRQNAICPIKNQLKAINPLLRLINLHVNDELSSRKFTFDKKPSDKSMVMSKDGDGVSPHQP